MQRLRARVLTPISEFEIEWLDDALVQVNAQGKLESIAPYEGGPVDEDLRPSILCPGFIDTHLHFPQTRIVGSASGPLLSWLATSVFPEESRFAELAYAQRVADEFCRRLAAAGTTTSLVYGSVHAEACDALLAAMAASGLRAIAGPVWMERDAPTDLCRDSARTIDGMDRLRERWHGHEDRVFLAVLPRFALSCDSAMLRAAGEYASRHRLTISTHLAETEEECRLVRQRFGTSSYVDVYADHGILAPGTVLAHCIHLDEAQWQRLTEFSCVVAHCPDSNDFLGSGSMPTATAQAQGLPITLGSDVAAGRTFRIPRIASAAFDNALRVGTRLDPATLFWWATAGAASALGLDGIGRLASGMQADMVLHELPSWVEDAPGALASIFFGEDESSVTRTWVRGREIWSGG